MPGQALFLMGLQYHVHIEDVGGTLREGVDQVLVSASYQLFDDLELCIGQDACRQRLQGSMPRARAWWQWHFLAATAAAVVLGALVDSSGPESCGFIVAFPSNLNPNNKKSKNSSLIRTPHPHVQVCHMKSKPLTNLGTVWWLRVQRVDLEMAMMTTSFPWSTWQLCKSW